MSEKEKIYEQLDARTKHLGMFLSHIDELRMQVEGLKNLESESRWSKLHELLTCLKRTQGDCEKATKEIETLLEELKP